jgi:hypothetical protein
MINGEESVSNREDKTTNKNNDRQGPLRIEFPLQPVGVDIEQDFYPPPAAPLTNYDLQQQHNGEGLRCFLYYTFFFKKTSRYRCSHNNPNAMGTNGDIGVW